MVLRLASLIPRDLWGLCEPHSHRYLLPQSLPAQAVQYITSLSCYSLSLFLNCKREAEVNTFIFKCFQTPSGGYFCPGEAPRTVKERQALELLLFLFCFVLRFYLFLERGREGVRGRETSMCGYLLSAPYWGPGL